LEAPELDTVLQMEPHKSRVGRDNNHLPVPAGHPSSDGAQELRYTRRAVRRFIAVPTTFFLWAAGT